MQRANAVLERERQAGKLGERDIEALGDGEGGYIEMNLGLGVLEEKGGEGGRGSEDGSGDRSESGSECGSGSDDGEAGGEGEVGKGGAEGGEGGIRDTERERGRRKEGSVLGRLMGGERRRAKPGIQVI